MELRLLFITVCLFGITQSAPRYSNINKCSQKCSQTKENFNYEVGKTYIYNYDSETKLNQNDGNGPKVDLKAKVKISVVAPCELSLQLSEVKVRGPAAEHEYIRALEKDAIRFSFDDGKVTDVCHPDEEEAWVANLKKGIISALQVSLKNLEGSQIVRERDVLGDCETTYQTLSRSWNGVHIKKTKNMKTCDKRHVGFGSIFPKSYSSLDTSSIHGLPILSNDFVCDIIVNKDIVQHSQCLEKNSFLPLVWSKSNSNVETKVKLILDLVQDGLQVQGPRSFHRKNLLYAQRETPSMSEDQVMDSLRDLCQSVKDDIQPQAPEKFAEIVQSLRQLPKESVQKIWTTVRTGSLCRSQKLVDMLGYAMIMDSSTGSIQAITQMIKNKEIGQIKANYWLTLLAFTSQPSEGSIEAAIPLLEKFESSRQALLGVSAMIHNFCSSKDCGSNQVVKKAVQVIAEQIGNSCRGQEKEIIIALKALRNVGAVAPALDKILQCVATSKNALRVAAIEALEEIPCEDQVQNKLNRILMNDEAENAEVRIAAYKVLIQCPSNRLVKNVLSLLERETCAQVGAYITSHLKNVQSSSDPNKQHIREALQGIQIVNKFEKDIRKFSRNMELSYVLSRMNLGGVLDSDIIYDHSFVPRSLKLNVTLPLFGRSLNLFEVGLRQVGLEDKLTSIFGSKGIVERNWDKKPELFKELMQFFQAQNQRSSRRTITSVLRGEEEEQPMEAAMYLKFDGKTIFYADVNDVQEVQTQLFENYEDHWDSIKSSVQEAQDSAFSFMLLNNVHEFPTSNGVPLKMALNGTLILGIKKTDGQSFWPSMAMEVSAKMGFDVASSSPGLKWVNRIHSAPGIKTKIEKKNGIPVKLTLDLLREKMDLFSFKSEMKLVDHQGFQQSLHANDAKTLRSCPGSLLGIKLCGRVKTPVPLFNLSTPVLPLNGLWMAEISVQKTEESMKGWEFELQFPTEQKSTQVYRAAFNTPGSRVDREIAVELHLSSNKPGARGARVLLKTPVKQVDASAITTYDENEVSIKTHLKIDDQSDDYSMLASIQKGQRGRKMEWKPKFELSIPGKRMKTIAGSITIDQGRKSSLNVRIHDNDRNDFIRGSMIKDGSISRNFRLSSDIRADLGIIALRIFGASEKSPASFSADVSVEYKFPQMKSQKVKFVTKVQNLSIRSLTKLTSFLELQMSAISAYNFHINWNLLYKPKEHLENEGIFMWGNNFQNLNRKVRLLQVSKFTGIYRPSAMKTAENVLYVEIRPLKIDYEIQFNGHMQQGELPKFKIETVAMEKRKRKEYRASTEYNHIQSKPLKLLMGALVKYPGREIKYSDKLDEVRPNEYQGKTKFQWQVGKSSTLDYNYKVKSDRSKLHHEVDMSLTHPNLNGVINHLVLLKMSPEEFQLNSKMTKGGRQLWDGKSLISRTGKSDISLQTGDLYAKLESNHFSDPAVHNFILKKDRYQYSSNLQYNRDSIDFNSKTMKDRNNLMNINSRISQRSGSHIQLKTEPYEGKMEWNHVSRPITGSLELMNRHERGTVHKTSFIAHKSQLDFNSKTQVRGKMVNRISSTLSRRDQSTLKVDSPNWTTQLEGYLSGPRKKASLNVKSNRNSYLHKTDLSIERGLLKLTSNTEKDRKSILSVDSALSNQQKSHLHVQVQDKSGKVELNPFGYAKSGKVQFKNKQIDHSSEVNIKPEVVQFDSKTEKDGRQIVSINGKLGDRHILKMRCPKADISLDLLPMKSIDFQIGGPSPIKHQTTIKGERGTLVIGSKTKRQGRTLFNLNSTISTRQPSNIKVDMGPYTGSLEVDPHSRIQTAKLKVRDSSVPMLHMTNVQYQPTSHFDLDSKTLHRGQEMLNLNSRIQNGRSYLKVKTNALEEPIEGQIEVDPSQTIRTAGLHLKHQLGVHLTKIQYKPDEMLALESTTQHDGRRLLKIDSKISPSSESWLNVNTESVSGNIKVAPHTIPKTVRFELNSERDWPINHLTNVEYTEGQEFSLDSNTRHSGQEVARIATKISKTHPSKVVLDIVPLRATFDLDHYGHKKSFNYDILKKDTQLTHSTSFDYQPAKVVIKSQASAGSEPIYSMNSELNSRTKSHFNLNSSQFKGSLEVDPFSSLRSTRFVLNGKTFPHQHSTEMYLGNDKMIIRSETSKHGRKLVKLESTWSKKDASHLNFKSQLMEANVKVMPFGRAPNGEIQINGKQIPLKHSSNLDLQPGKLLLKTMTSYDDRRLFDLNSNLKMEGESRMTCKTPFFEGDLKVHPQEKRFSINYLDKYGPRNRRILCSSQIKQHPKNSVDFDLDWDADGDKEKKIKFSMDGDKKGQRHLVNIRGELGSTHLIQIKTIMGKDLIRGPHEVNAQVNIPNHPVNLVFEHEIKNNNMRCAFRYIRDGREKAELVQKIKFQETGNGHILDASLKGVSVYKWIDGLNLQVMNQYSNSRSSDTFQSSVTIQMPGEKPFKISSKLSKQSDGNKRELSGFVKAMTPIYDYQHQEASWKLNWNKNQVKMTGKAVALGKGADFEASLDQDRQGYEANLKVESQIESIPTMEVKGKLGLWIPNKIISLTTDVNRRRLIEMEGEAGWRSVQDFDGKWMLKSQWTSKYDVKLSGKANSQMVNYKILVNQDDRDLFDASLTGRRDRRGIHGEAKVAQEGIFSLVLKNSKVSDGVEYKIIYDGPVRPLDITYISGEGRNIKEILKVCPRGVACLEFQAIYRNDDNYSATDRFARLLFRRKQSEYKIDWMYRSLSSQYDNKLVFDFDGVLVGYNVQMSGLSSGDSLLGQVFLAERRMEVRGMSRNNQLQLEIFSDAQRQPNRKLKIEIRHNNVNNYYQRKVDIQMTITHPVWRRPLASQLKYDFNSNNQANPLSIQLTLDFTRDPTKKLYIGTEVLHPKGDQRNTTVKIYANHQDKQELDIGMYAHVAAIENLFSAGLNWNWVDRQSRKLQGFHLIKADSDTKQALIVSRCPMNDFLAKCEWEVTPSAIVIDGNFQVNGQSKNAQMKLTTDEKPCVIVKIIENKWSVCIDTTGKSILNMTIGTPEESKELSFAFYQHGDRIYRFHLKWRPEVIGELLYAAGRVADANIPLKSYDLKTISKEVRHKMKVMKSTIHEDVIQPSSRSLYQEMNDLKNELSIDDKYLEPFQRAGSVVVERAEKLQEFIVQLLERILPESFQNMIERWAENVTRYMTEACAYNSNCYAYAYKYQKRGWRGLRSQLGQDVEEMVKSFKLSNIWYQIQQWSKNLIDSTMNSELVKKGEEIVVNLVRLTEETADVLIERLENVLQKIDDSMESNPEIQDVYRNFKKMALETQRKIKKNIRNVDWKRLSSLTEDLIQFLTSPEFWASHTKFLTWNLEDGEVLIEFLPPIHPATLKSIWKSKRQTSEYISLRDQIVNIQSTLNSEWLPPFSGQAMLIGGQHFITFDGHSYDFASSSCSYYLAKDPRNPSFSVQVQYRGLDSDRQVRKSIIVQQNDRRIEIIPEEKTVKLNGNVMQLPMFLEQGLRIQREKQAIVLITGNGMKIDCSLKQDLVTMTLNRWQFNKLVGMFGSYDHEPMNDMKTPNGKIVKKVQEFARSWEAGRCRSSQNIARTQMAQPGTEAYRLCKEHFADEGSTLRNAFSILKPKKYFNLCLRYTGTQRSTNPKRGFCSVAAGYQRKAKFFGIEIDLPSTCLQCESLDYGQRQRHRPPYGNRNADVVFIIEEDSCNRHLAKQIDTIARLLERDLRSEGFSDTLFGMVSYGQEEKEVMRTAGGETMFPARDVLSSVEGMRFHNRRASEMENLEAILMAAEYGWRKGASKNLILLTCNKCKISDYSMVEHLLLERGITLHVVNEAPIATRSVSTSKSRGFFGLDARAVYDLKSLQTRILEGQADLRSQVRAPKDVCVALAQESGGSYFSSQLLVRGRSLEQKQWRSVFSRRVIKSAEPDQCQRCHCTMEPGQLSSRTLCKPCRPRKPLY